MKTMRRGERWARGLPTGWQVYSHRHGEARTENGARHGAVWAWLWAGVNWGILGLEEKL